jgi:tetratricopeptide (TPR) repeat protein
MLPYLLALLAEAYENAGQAEEGVTVLDEALSIAQNSGERQYEADLYRLKGVLALQAGVRSQKSEVKNSSESRVQGPRSSKTKSQSLDPKSQGEAEACFLKAIEISRRQQAKSLELRATMSLVRLRQQQALEQGGRSKELGVGGQEQEARTRLTEAHKMLSELYNWFTEGFDTADLKDAKTLIEALSQRCME